jgi:hypothetical protein
LGDEDGVTNGRYVVLLEGPPGGVEVIDRAVKGGCDTSTRPQQKSVAARTAQGLKGFEREEEDADCA